MDRLTKEQATVLTAMTGTILMSPTLFRKEIEKKMGREVFPAEWATEDFQLKLKTEFLNDFLNICCVEEPSEIVLLSK